MIVLILIANVKYPSSESYFLSANSYVIEKGNMQELEKSEQDFRSNVEQEGCTIVNFMAYIVPQEHIAGAK